MFFISISWLQLAIQMNFDEQNQVKGHLILLMEGQELFHTIHLKSESECISIQVGEPNETNQLLFY